MKWNKKDLHVQGPVKKNEKRIIFVPIWHYDNTIKVGNKTKHREKDGILLGWWHFQWKWCRNVWRRTFYDWNFDDLFKGVCLCVVITIVMLLLVTKSSECFYFYFKCHFIGQQEKLCNKRTMNIEWERTVELNYELNVLCDIFFFSVLYVNSVNENPLDSFTSIDVSAYGSFGASYLYAITRFNFT